MSNLSPAKLDHFLRKNTLSSAKRSTLLCSCLRIIRSKNVDFAQFCALRDECNLAEWDDSEI